MSRKVNYINLTGSHKEIGRILGKIIGKNSMLKVPPPQFFTEKDFDEAINLYNKYCPGIREELEGFSEESNIPIKEICL